LGEADMARIVFAPAIQRHVAVDTHIVAAQTLDEALQAVFALTPALRDYIVDEQGQLRKHVTIFIDNEQIDNRRDLAQIISDNAEIYVVQALSGG
jgi:sulfur-carrier protein